MNARAQVKCKQTLPNIAKPNTVTLAYFSLFADSLTEVELSNIARDLLPLRNHEIADLAHVLQFSEPDIDRVMKQSSDAHDRLLILLHDFKKRCPATRYGTRRCLAKALMEWGHLSVALRLYPRSKTLL